MVYFSDFFQIDEDVLDKYGAFNVSLLNDMPLFVDPFLLFGSTKQEYKQLHDDILDYLAFLKEKAETGLQNKGQIKAWYQFPEVKQNWLGYSLVGNNGSGLGKDFGEALSKNMPLIFGDIKQEVIAETSHLEKAGLFQIGVGRDNISDFTCNLIKEFLLKYSEQFALMHLKPEDRREVSVSKVYFDYELERWMPKTFILPYKFGDFVLLTPKDILTKDENWINNADLRGKFDTICLTIPNDQLREEIQNYFARRLPNRKNKRPSAKERAQAIVDTLHQFPEIIEYYIKYKESDTEGAKLKSAAMVKQVEGLFVKNIMDFRKTLAENSDFYNSAVESSYDESMKRVVYLKKVIEENDGYRLFYVNGSAIQREQDLQVIYKLTWFATAYDVNREPNNGRGPVDYAISKGNKDKTLVEFKLASNSQLKRNLQNQVPIYEQANDTKSSIKVILYFNASELQKVKGILKELKLEKEQSIVLIDACQDNKPSASKA